MRKELIPITAKDCINVEPLPDTHDVRVDLFYCARGLCSECSRRSEQGCRKTEVGGCLFGLLEDASELLAPYD